MSWPMLFEPRDTHAEICRPRILIAPHSLSQREAGLCLLCSIETGAKWSFDGRCADIRAPCQQPHRLHTLPA